MNNFTTISTIAALMLNVVVGSTAMAQNWRMSRFSRSIYHEISFGGTVAAGGIIQTFNKKTVDIKSRPGMSGGAQINYTLHFNENFSLVFGAAVKYCQNTYGFARLDESSVYKLHVSSETDTFLFNANIWNYTETYSALYVQIPILFSYETDHPLIKWYINAGLAAQFTVYSKYRTKISPLTTYGYSTYNKSRIDSIPRFGFGTVPNMKVDGKPTLKFTLNGYIETGIKVSIGRGKWLYIGVFGEMSILKNSVAKVEGSGSEYVINYAPNSNSIELTDQFNVTSITNTKYTSGGRTYAFGGVVRIGFDFRTANRMLSSPYRRRR